jgi:HlyD family secretion protein
MKKILSILFGALFLVGFAGTFYYLYSKSKDEPVVYSTETPSVKTIIQKTVATGSVVPRKEVAIKPQVSGIIEHLAVEPGDKVKRGDLIAQIRIIPDMVTLNNAENRLRMAEIQNDNAQRELTRNKDLLARGVISEATFVTFELGAVSAKQELEAAVENLELIRKGSTEKSGKSSNTMVKATIDGMVLEVPLEEGDSVIESNTFNDGTTLAAIADMDELIFEGKVDESEVGKIRTGMTLLLTIGAIEGESFEAVLEHIAPKGIEENGAIQFEVRAALKMQNKAMIRANYSANADIVLDRRDEVLAISESLLQFEDSKPFVEVQVAQAYEKRFVETGLSDDIYIEVVSGVSESDAIKNPNSGR